MAFNINNFLNTESKKEINNDWKPLKISIHKLKPAPGNTNFYHAEEKEIRELAESIELVGLQQYPVRFSDIGKTVFLTSKEATRYVRNSAEQ